jgi:uncharacterized protein YbjT (DUF2867 family)
MILITGGTGTVGSEVVKQLAAAGTKFRVLARDPKKVAAGANVEVVKGDLTDLASVEAALQGIDKLFLLTNSTPGSTEVQNNVVDTAKKAGVKHVVRLSVLGADKASPVVLAQWHAAGDEHLKQSGLKWTILQPGSFMQNTIASASTVKKDAALYGAAGEGKMATIDARDIAAAAVKVLTTSGHEGKTYPLTGKEALSYGDIAAKIGKAIGKPVKYVNLPGEQFKGALVGAGLPEWLAKDYVTMHGYQSSGGMATTDPTLGSLIGNVRTFDDFLSSHAPAFK